MFPGKLTVNTANPSEAVLLPLHSASAFPRAAEGSILWNPDNKKIYVYAPNSDGDLVWQETQRQ